MLSGANEPSTDTSSIDPITYNGPLGGGLTVGGTVEFNWQYNSPYGLNDAAYFAWMPAGGGSTNQVLLAQGGGVASSIYSIQLDPHATFEFVLFTETPANKLPGSLVITNFQFHANVPEPSAEALLASALIFLGGTFWWRPRRRASIQS